MNVNKSELLTRDESEGDRCLGDTSDLQRMYASHSKMDTGGDRPVGGTRSESITTGYSVTVRGGKNLAALATVRRHQLRISSRFCTLDLLVHCDMHIFPLLKCKYLGGATFLEV